MKMLYHHFLLQRNQHRSPKIVAMFVLCVLCVVCPVYSQEKLGVVLRDDSLRRTGFLSMSIGRKSLDVNSLNESLKKSSLNTIGDAATFVEYGVKLNIWNGLLVGGDLNYCFGISSKTTDKFGTFTTSIASLGVDLNVGYPIVNTRSTLVIPSIGLGMSYCSTDITLARNGQVPPSPQDHSESGIREQLVNYPDGRVSDYAIPAMLMLKLDMFYKVWSSAVVEEEVAVRGPHPNIMTQTKDEIWLGGYVSKNSLSGENNSMLASIDFTHDRDNTAFAYSGLNFGISLLWSMSGRMLDM